MHSAWGLLRVCAACPTPRLNQSYELRPPWGQYLRYVPHRVRNGYNRGKGPWPIVMYNAVAASHTHTHTHTSKPRASVRVYGLR